jgi:fumarate reductase subunit D
VAKVNKALFWSLFAAGGTVTAFVFPVLVLITLIAAHGNPPAIMGFEQMQGLLANWFGKLVAFGTVSLALWHSAHRLRTALHGLGLRADGAVATIGYGIALVGTILTAYYLLQI